MFININVAHFNFKYFSLLVLWASSFPAVMWYNWKRSCSLCIAFGMIQIKNTTISKSVACSTIYIPSVIISNTCIVQIFSIKYHLISLWVSINNTMLLLTAYCFRCIEWRYTKLCLYLPYIQSYTLDNADLMLICVMMYFIGSFSLSNIW